MVIVILAAGASRRMGCQKLLLPVDGRPMVNCVIDAAAEWPIVVVAGDEVAALLASTALPIVRNAMPERGMAHSLRLANQVVAQAEPIAVVLGDLPDITAADMRTAIAAYDNTVDVVIPVGSDATHPVIFGPLARRKIADLPDGDTIKELREHPALRRRYFTAGPQIDIDTPEEYRRRSGYARYTPDRR